MAPEPAYKLDSLTYRAFYPRFILDDFCYYPSSQ